MLDFDSIDVLSLPSVGLDDRATLPPVAAIYFAIDSRGVIQYIGRTINLQIRWLSHHRYRDIKGLGDVQIAWLNFSDPDLLPEIEEALISHFSPPLNGKILPVPPRARSLRWRLREVMSRYKISNKHLADELQRHEASISRLKNADSMPRMDGTELSNLCNALTNLLRNKGTDYRVTHMDLLEFIPDQQREAS